MNENIMRKLRVLAKEITRPFRLTDGGSGQTGRRVLQVLFLAAAYVFFGWLGSLLAVPPGYATAVFPAAGVALAALLLYGAPLAPGVWLGSFIMNLAIGYQGSGHVTATNASVAATIAIGSTAQALAGVWLIRRAIGFPNALDREKDIGLFLLLGGPLSCLVSATTGVTSLHLYGVIASDQYLQNWVVWWVGDAIGVVVTTPLLFAILGKPRPAWRPRRTALVLPPIALLAASVVLFLLASRWEQDRLRVAFHQRADTVATNLQTGVGGYLQFLHAIERFFVTSGTVERHKFHQFVQTALRDFPGLAALSWNPRVRDAERASFEAAVRREGYAGFRILERDAQGQLRPATRRDEYIVVTYIEPYAGNEAALGYDIDSDARRRAAIERSHDSGATVATGRIRLLQEPGEQWGILLLQPVYRDGEALNDAESRRRALQGFAAGVLRMSSIVQAAMPVADRHDMSLRFLDESAPQSERTLYQINANIVTPAAEALRFDDVFEAAGRSYRIVALPTPAYLAAHPALVAWSVLAASLVFCALLEAFLLFVTGRAAHVARLVEERTRELRDSRERLALAIEGSNQALFDWDVVTGKVVLGEQWSRIVGGGHGNLITTINDFQALIHPDDLPQARQQGADLVRGQRSFYYVEHRVRSETGDWLWVASRAKVVERDAVGRATRVAGTNVDITERKEIERLKNSFIAAVSHELRTPLNAIIGITEMLIEDARDLKRGEEEIEPLERVLRAGRHLLALINDILDLSKIEAGKMELYFDSFPIAPLVEDVVKTIQPLAQKNGNQLVVNCSADIGTMYSDQTRVQQALLNLVSNANKFTERGKITISARRAAEDGGAWITLVVTDTGIGMTPELMGRLFQEFVQADATTHIKYGGTGLGLVISRRLSQMMGGDITVESEVGQGSTFTIRLPVEVLAAQLVPLARSPQTPQAAGARS
ncbi:MAG: PAS domain S-box protein [Deltaproteobacteria bacterium]|nr:MAG: PAS domain S-box protein [Deltaproteobacteria bacterium]